MKNQPANASPAPGLSPALIVIDMQLRLAPAMADYQQVCARVKLLTEVADKLEIEHIITEQNPLGLGATDPCLINASAKVVAKDTFSAVQSEAFIAAIEELEESHFFLCGMESHVCVYHTANELLAKGYQVSVLADAVCSRDPENKTLALAQLRHNGAQVCSSETAIFAWMNSCRHPQFRDILALIK
ncbi:isochorismatase family protein [Pseudoalteromonas sp. T1lg75]|uniref:isochorismatase family protein n=1 Tax=Pseudoalteromonas sp. T1lg75 TaxID=2077102 RepID=UPI00131A2863|nr:isochorismatase family protein [Pseudoalteromonas sp. T1lg75]